MTDDAELLRRYVEDGSESAFAEFVQRHVAMVYSSVLRQLNGDAHAAEDVVQVVFNKLARQAGSLLAHPSLAGWLFLTARHVSSKLMRTRRRRAIREQKFHAMDQSSHPAAAEADWSALRPVLDGVIAQLDNADREAILLRFFEQRPFADIGVALQVSEDAARKRVERALLKLGALLARHEITSTASALAVALATQSTVAVPTSFAAAISRGAIKAAGGSTGAVLRFVRGIANSKSGIGIAASALIVVISALLYEVRGRRENEQALAPAAADLNARLAVLTDVQTRINMAAAARDQLAQQVNMATSAAWDPVAEGKAFLLAHPDVKRAMMEHSRAKFNFRFGPLCRSLGLTPRQVSQFQDLVRELQPVNRSAGIDGKELVISEGDGMPALEVERRLRELLGSDGYAQFKSAQQIVPARRLVFELAESLCFTDAPLDAYQAEQMVDLLGARRTARGFDWNAIASQAELILSVPQRAALAELKAQNEIQRVLGFAWRGPFPGPSATYMPRQ